MGMLVVFLLSCTTPSLSQIEEPTKDDDILGHAKIATALKPTGIR